MRTDLPETCLSTVESTGELIVLKRGETGYFRTARNTDNRERNKAIAEAHNRSLGLTSAQVEAMRMGSMFGFNVPGAVPQQYLDLAKEQYIEHVEGFIMDFSINLSRWFSSELRVYEVAGATTLYIDPFNLPREFLNGRSGYILHAEMVDGLPLVPIARTGKDEKLYRLADNSFERSSEVNQGYHVFLDVRAGKMEFVVAENPMAPSRYVTWAAHSKEPVNDTDRLRNYFWGHYCTYFDAAIMDFCDRAAQEHRRSLEPKHRAPRSKAEAER